MYRIYSTRDLAKILGTREWRVRRLFESGDLPEPARFGGKRAIPEESIPAVINALRDRGWLPADARREEAGAWLEAVDKAIAKGRK